MNRETLVIGKMRVYGFASIKEMKYNFSRPGLSTMVGENGVGKTSAINAMYWAIYGKTIKVGCSITPWVTVQDGDFVGTMVELSMHREKDTYKVIRCSDYSEKVLGSKGGNRLILVVNGEVSPLRDKKLIQAEINRIVGSSPDLFKNSILFGQKLKRLIEEDGPLKKKIFEEAFDTLFIPEAKERIEKKIAPLSVELKVKENTLKSIQETLENIRDSIKTAKKLGKEAQEKWEKDLNEWSEKKRLAQIAYKELSDHPEYDEEIGELEDKVLKLTSKEKELNNRELKANLKMNTSQGLVEELKNKLDELKERYIKVPRKCDECGQKLPAAAVEMRKQNLKDKIAEVNTQIEKARKTSKEDSLAYHNVLTDQASFKIKSVKKIKKYKERLSDLQQLKEANAAACGAVAERIQTAKEQIIILEANPPKLTHNTLKSLRGMLDKKKQEIEELTSDINKLARELHINQWLIKDPLSNGGLKAYIFDARLKEVNQALRKYEPYIGFRIEAGIDLDKHNKDFYINIYKNKISIPYSDLSGGQQQLTNLALAFSIYDVRAKMNPISCMIADEAFESLSQNNLEIVSDILQDKANKISVHVITHQKGFNPLNCYRRVIELNDRGQTVITSKLQQN